MNYLRKNKSLFMWLSLILLSAIPLLLPLLHKGFFRTDDGEWMIIRFSAFHQALRDGQIPVRFLSRLNHGYGYPVANFLYPGFMYLAEPFKLIGMGFVNSIKMIFGLSLVGSGIGTFFWLRKLFPEKNAYAGSIISLYLPYHLYDIYIRGSIGEMLALAIVPFILWQIERKGLSFIALGVGFLLLSHNTLAILFLPVISIYWLIRLPRKEWRQVGITITSGFGLAAFFWIPALFELSFTKFSSIKVSEVSHYFASTDIIGPSSLFIFGLSLFLLTRRDQDTKYSRLLLLFAATSAISIFYSSPLSSALWQYLPSSFIQFPFRLLSFLTISLSFLTAYALWYFKGNAKFIIALLLVSVIFYSALPYVQPKEYFDKGEGFYTTNEDTTTVKNEYMPRWVTTEPTIHAERKVGVTNGTISDELHTSTLSHFRISGNGETTVQVHTIYYPGWKAYSNNQPIAIDYTNQGGLMQFTTTLPADISVRFSETPLRLLSDFISLFFCLWLFVYPYIWMQKKMVKKHA